VWRQQQQLDPDTRCSTPSLSSYFRYLDALDRDAVARRDLLYQVELLRGLEVLEAHSYS
jgi:hypothetical protein